MKLLMIDNYDSFVYNLVQYFAALNCEVIVRRNDEITIDGIKSIDPDAIVISPGPCTPDEAGVSLDIIRYLSDHYPILGVCLGHQSIVQALGGKIIRANEIMHGKVSEITHEGSGIYQGLPSPLSVTRYHSLVADPSALPDCLHVTAECYSAHTAETTIMSIAHKTLPIFGVQYHPESILTQSGQALLNNFLRLAQKNV